MQDAHSVVLSFRVSRLPEVDQIAVLQSALLAGYSTVIEVKVVKPVQIAANRKELVVMFILSVAASMMANNIVDFSIFIADKLSSLGIEARYRDDGQVQQSSPAKSDIDQLRAPRSN